MMIKKNTNKESFNSQKNKSSYTMEISAPTSIVFPLLCPIREYEWIDGWKCDLIYSDSGVAEDLCVFKTNTPPFGEETWVCTRYELNKAIRYTRFSNNVIVVTDIELSDNDDSKSFWTWTLSVLSMNETGNSIINSFTPDVMHDKLKGLEVLLEHFITTGQKRIK